MEAKKTFYDYIVIFGVPGLLGVVLGWILFQISNRRKTLKVYEPGKDLNWKNVVTPTTSGRGFNYSFKIFFHNPNAHPQTLRDVFCRPKGQKQIYLRKTSIKDIDTGKPVSSSKILNGWDMVGLNLIFTSDGTEVQDTQYNELEIGYLDIKGKEKSTGIHKLESRNE